MKRSQTLIIKVTIAGTKCGTIDEFNTVKADLAYVVAYELHLWDLTGISLQTFACCLQLLPVALCCL